MGCPDNFPNMFRIFPEPPPPGLPTYPRIPHSLRMGHPNGPKLTNLTRMPGRKRPQISVILTWRYQRGAMSPEEAAGWHKLGCARKRRARNGRAPETRARGSGRREGRKTGALPQARRSSTGLPSNERAGPTRGRRGDPNGAKERRITTMGPEGAPFRRRQGAGGEPQNGLPMSAQAGGARGLSHRGATPWRHRLPDADACHLGRPPRSGVLTCVHEGVKREPLDHPTSISCTMLRAHPLRGARRRGEARRPMVCRGRRGRIRRKRAANTHVCLALLTRLLPVRWYAYVAIATLRARSPEPPAIGPVRSQRTAGRTCSDSRKSCLGSSIRGNAGTRCNARACLGNYHRNTQGN